MPDAAKVCAVCRRLLPASAYRLNRNMLSGLHSRCRECTAEANRAWREAHPTSVWAYNEARRIPPTKLTCTECGETFYGRKDRLTCSRRCKDARYRRLPPRSTERSSGVASNAAEPRPPLEGQPRAAASRVRTRE
jgi:hypothetical protein